MKYFRLVILLSFCSADIKLESQEILDALYQDQSWELQKITEDSLYIYKKDILYDILIVSDAHNLPLFKTLEIF